MSRTLPRQKRRPPRLRRSWLFVPGADRDALEKAASLGADVAIQELEDFTIPEQRPQARRLSHEVLSGWRKSGTLAAVRINPLEGTDGFDDLEAAIAGRADIVMLPKSVSARQIIRLDRHITEMENRNGIEPGSTEIVPNIETAAGLVAAGSIAAASKRVTAMLVASEDMVADLGAERSPDGGELAYVRSRFIVECVASGVTAIDCPYTFSDNEGARAETASARMLGYTAKSAVTPGHVAVINDVLTPSAAQLEMARRIVGAFEKARAGGADRVTLDGHMIELPRYSSARSLLERGREFAALAAKE